LVGGVYGLVRKAEGGQRRRSLSLLLDFFVFFWVVLFGWAGVWFSGWEIVS
jgi:hypothetical protein